ncbi:MAG: hypothetical protein LBT44_10215, partial [Clostridiales bacterium]|nr:hypothetical protein [Clostridiales bacterium]
MLDKNLAMDVLAAALSAGGGFAEIFMENNEKNSLVMTNGVTEKALWGVEYGCGIRVFRQCRSGAWQSAYAYTNDTSGDNLLAIAKETAAAAAAGAKSEKTEPLFLPALNRLKTENVHCIAISPSSGGKSLAAEKLRQAAESACAMDPRITQTAGSFMGITQDVLIVNSEGLWAEDRRVRTRLMFSAAAS